MPETASKEVCINQAFSSQELSGFCKQLATILKAGIPLGEGLSILAEEYIESQKEHLMQAISTRMDMGEPLSSALKSTSAFPHYMVTMVEIGEQSGHLDDVLESLCEYYERDTLIKNSIKNAVLYPSIMVVMMVAIVGVLVSRVLPIFHKVYQQLGGTLPPFSESLIRLGSGLSHYSTGMLAFLVVLCFVAGIIFFNKRARTRFIHGLETFFLTKKLFTKIATARFAMALSLLLSSGMDMNTTLQLSQNLVNNKQVNKKIAACLSALEAGAPFAQAMNQTGLFTSMECKMISVGFKTGTSDAVIDKLAQHYTQNIEEQLAKTIAVIEPTLVAVLSIVVGFILLSVMLPLLGILSAM